MKKICFVFLLVGFVAVSLASAGQAAEQQGAINFSFDQVDVRSFVKLVGEITGRKFIVADDVKGKITVTSPAVSRNDVYPLFLSILESADCSVVQEGEILRVVSLPPRSAPSAPVITGSDKMPEGGLITRVIKLQNISAAQVKKSLDQFTGAGKIGGISAVEETDHILITDTVESVKRIEKIIAEIDQPGMSKMTEVVRLEFAGANDLADQLNVTLDETYNRAEALASRLPRVPGRVEGGSRGAVVVASPHANSLILVGSQSQINELKKLIKMMDVDIPSGRGRLNAIFLKYLLAEDASKSLNALLARVPASGQAGGAQSFGADKKIAIEALPANNALIVDAMPGDFEAVKKLIEELDKVPEQVHISVLIAEYSMDDDFKLGFEMAALDVPDEVGANAVQGGMRLTDTAASSLMNVVQSGIFPGGITIGVAHGTRLDADGNIVAGYPGFLNIDAVKKSGFFEIKSETSLTVQNNKEASVNVVNQIPILKSTISAGTGTERDVIENIERMDVGVKLKLVPHIIPGGEVQMVLNPSIEAVTDPGPTGTQFAPTIARREVSTTVTVPDGNMIVIAGLTREDNTKVDKRVPVLGAIPIVGRLFRHTVEENQKMNMVIFVSPTIVTDVEKANALTSDWEKKTGLSNDEKK